MVPEPLQPPGQLSQQGSAAAGSRSVQAGTTSARRLEFEDPDDQEVKYRIYHEHQTKKVWTYILIFTLCILVWVCVVTSYVVLKAKAANRVDPKELARAELELGGTSLQKEVRMLRKRLVDEEKMEAKLQGQLDRDEKAIKELREQESKLWGEENKRWGNVSPELMRKVPPGSRPIIFPGGPPPHVARGLPLPGKLPSGAGAKAATTDLNKGDPNDLASTFEKLPFTADVVSKRGQTFDQMYKTMTKNNNSEAAIRAAARAVAKEMTKEELLGSILVVGVSTYEYSPQLHEHLKRGNIGGLFLHRDLSAQSNTVGRVRKYTDWLKQRSRVAWGDSLPLIISSDDEGGHFNNYPYAFKEWPNNLAIAAVNSTAKAYMYGRQYGKDIRSTGVNVVFAPCMDVNVEPLNPVIGLRSFGSNPSAVARMGVSVMKGFLASGIFPTLKHFPGHGRTKLDSHIALPSVTVPLKALEETELPPFQAGVLAGVPLVMTGHLIVPSMETQQAWPATFSKKIITGYLRKKLGFRGVVVTDSLSMAGAKKAAAAIGNKPGEVFFQALMAGNDLLMDSTSLHPGAGDWDAIRKLILEKATASKHVLARLRDAGARVLELKYKILAAKTRIQSDVSGSHASGAGASGNQKQDLVNDMYRASATVVRDEASSSMLPLKARASSPGTLVLFPNTINVKETEAAFKGARFVHFAQNVPCNQRTQVLKEVKQWAEGQESLAENERSPLVFAVHNFNTNKYVLMHTIYKEQIELEWSVFKFLKKKKMLDQVLFVSIENPYDLLSTPPFPTVAVAFGSGRYAMQALWKKLIEDPKGVLPRDLPVDVRKLMPTKKKLGKPPKSREAECAAHIHNSAPRPPSVLPKNLMVLKGKAGQSCSTVCLEAKKACAPQHFNELNNCDMLNSHFTCKECMENLGMDQPAMVKPTAARWAGRCLFTGDMTTEVGFHGVERCMAKHTDTVRLCPCMAQ